MAMSGPQLAEQVQAALEASGLTFITSAQLVAFCTAVVNHIQNNADVKAGITSTGADPQGGTVTVTSEIHSMGIQ